MTWHGPFFTGGWLVSILLLAAILLLAGSVDGVPTYAVVLSLIVGIPLILVVILGVCFAVGEVIDWVRHRAARRRESAGCCVRCGYDLRETEEKCPECGMPVWRARDPLTGKVIDRRSSDAE